MNYPKVWLLATGDSRKYMYLRPHTLIDYWQENFVGQVMPENWSPPPIIIGGKSKKLGDFVSWMLTAPVISERAKQILEPIFGDSVQFLRFHDINKRPYYAINVLRVEENWLDEYASEGPREPKTGELIGVFRYFFKNLPRDIPPIFKVQPNDSVFVNQAVAEAIVSNKLTGAALQNPAKSGIALAATGEPINSYPGVI